MNDRIFVIAEFLLEGSISFVWTLTVSSEAVSNGPGSNVLAVTTDLFSDALLFLQNSDSVFTVASRSGGDSMSVNSTARPISRRLCSYNQHF